MYKTIEKSEHYYNNDKDYKSHFWIFKYEEIRDLVLDYKFNEKSYLYETFSKIILKNEKANEILRGADYIVPVPIHKKRMMERGYNQCSLITKELSKNIETLVCLSNILKKTKKTRAQSLTSKNERCTNVKDTFTTSKKIDLKGKRIILFDDVYTTGSTVAECAKVLKTLGCERIDVFTIAKD